MKTIYTFVISAFLLIPTLTNAQSKDIDVNVLVGMWKLDMTPQDTTDENFAMMKITKVENNTFKGEFYREGVKIKNAQLNTQLGIIYGALISGDGTGDYNTTFYYKDGKLHGSTHAIERRFLAVWIATKEN
ncbi:hypothetical protein [Kordia jejudonensis]|uniref:hypothetical protein n=1 Tax=Kordia jejudonensis TaxID=1348245 RepID=UPI000629C5F8|nr:hypothetical protein [Kordia jejudonensis]